MRTPKNNTDIRIVIVVYIPFGWDHQHFWHRREPTEALAVMLRGRGGVLVVEPYMCPFTGWYRSAQREKLRQVMRQGKLRRQTDNLYILMPSVWLPLRWQHLRWVQRFNWRTLARQIRKTVWHIASQTHHVVSWFYRPDHVDFVGLAGEDRMVYECYDQHHTAYDAQSIPGRSELLQRQEKELLSKADIVFTTSEKLCEEKSKIHSNVHLFHNAANVSFFAKVQAYETTIPEVIREYRHPIVGFLGSIHRDMDIDLLRYVTEANPDWTFLMAGVVQDQEFAQSDAYQRLMTLSNVHFVGWIQDDIPNYFKAVDVCLIPFRTDSDFNLYRNPNKLHEYTAMGKPVVSTDIPCVRSHADITYIASTKEEFVACIDRALSEDGPELVAERLRRARDNTWEKRAERILEIIQTSL